MDRVVRKLGLCAMFAAVGLCSAAQAQEASSTQTEASERLRAGVKAYGERRFADAIQSFLVANRLAPAPALSFNIAKAYEKMGDPPNTLRWYRDYLRRAPSANDRAQVEEKIQALEQVLQDKGVQQITVMTIPAGATVIVDGKPVGVSPWTGQIPPGKHEITCRLRGYDDQAKEVVLEPERAMDVAITLVGGGETASEQPPQTSSAPSAVPSSSVDDRSTPGVGLATWTAFAVGAVGLGGSLGFEFARRSSEQSARDEPTQVGAREQFETMESRQAVSRILLGVGAAGVLTGGVLLYLDLTDEPSKDTSIYPSTPRVSAGCGSNTCGVMATGRFW